MEEEVYYENLCTRVEKIITERNLRIRVDTLNHESSIEQYDFVIYDANSIVATKLTIFYSDGQVLQGRTRRYYDDLHTQSVFNITWLFTSQEYQKQKLALLILIYSICYLKIKHVNTKYVTLDDDSENSLKIKNNIYNKTGFVLRDHLSFASHNLLNISGPEKQLLLDEEFIRRANKILSGIENPKVMHNGKYTVKELRNIATINKIKITTKMGKKTVPLKKKDLIAKLKNIINITV